MSVSTGAQETRVNYPPDAWLKREGWTPPVIVDDAESSAARAFGLHAYPFWVAVSPDGRSVLRTAGPLSIQTLELLVADLAAG